MILLGICGRAGSGKDSAFEAISEWSTRRGLLAVRRGFADKLKWQIMRGFFPTISIDDAVALFNEFKNDDDATITLDLPGRTPVTITVRQGGQHWGTEGGREVHGPDHWVNALLPANWESNFARADLAVITDVRFVSEAQRIRQLGGRIWEIERTVGLTLDQKHVSEAGLPYAMIARRIYNSGSLEQFRTQIQALMDFTFYTTPAAQGEQTHDPILADGDEVGDRPDPQWGADQLPR